MQVEYVLSRLEPFTAIISFQASKKRCHFFREAVERRRIIRSLRFEKLQERIDDLRRRT